jgi:amino acid adenylation domain-containing protein
MSQQQSPITTPLSPIQAGMIFETLAHNDAAMNLEQVVLHLDHEAIDVARMAQAWTDAIARHEALRLAFRSDGSGGYYQVVEPAFEAPLVVLDWTEEQNPTEALNTLLAEDRKRGVDFEDARSWRLQWLRYGEQKSKLVWTFSHVALDGRSMRSILEEVFAAYDAVPVSLPPRPAFTQHCTALAQADMTAAYQYFRQYLQGFDTPTGLGFAVGDNTLVDFGPLQTLTETLSVDHSDALRRRAEQLGASFATMVQAAWAVVLGRISGQDDVVFGVTRSGRFLTPESRDMIGCLITTQPLRVKIDGETTLDTLLAAIRSDLRAQRPHEGLALPEIAALTDLPKGTPLFHSLVMVERQSLNAGLRAIGEAWENRQVDLFEKCAKPITLAAYGDAGLVLQLDFLSNSVPEADAARYLTYLVHLLRAMAVAPPGALLSGLQMLPEAEAAELMALAAPVLPLPMQRPSCIAGGFEATAARQPAAPALKRAGKPVELDYASLDKRANQLAHRLRQWGIGPGAIVGLCLPRGQDLIALILATAKVGAAFLPMDPSYPPDTLLHMAEDSAVTMVFTNSAAHWMTNLTVVLISDSLTKGAPTTAPDRNWLTDTRPAYVIYTSGTTGKPKGVGVSQRSLVAHAMSAVAAYGLVPNDRVLQFAAISFDVALEEIVPTLLAGAALVLRDELMMTSPQAFCEVAAEQRITVLNLPTGFWQVLLRALEAGTAVLPPTVRLVIVGGERMPPDALARWLALPDLPRLMNGYGPTEATITSALFEPMTPVLGAEVPVGRSFGHALSYVRAPDGSLAPKGAKGELWVGGDAVAIGYLNQPGLTAERFVPDPFAGQGRMYRSGDVAHWNLQDQLVVSGRCDRQIKLRGFRIEPGEIEAVLESIPGIAQAYVGVADGRLFGWLRASNPDAAPEITAMKTYVGTQLPASKCPEIVLVTDWPQTPGGKTDVARLPLPELAAQPADADGLRDPVAMRIADIFAEILGREVPQTNVSFFDLGGHSLQLLSLLGFIEAVFSTRLSVAQIHAHPTPEGLAALLTTPAQAAPVLEFCECLMPIQPLGRGVTIYGVHVLGVNGSFFRPLAKAMGLNQPIFGLTVGLLSAETPTSVAETARLYFEAIQAHRPNGPVGLVAVSLGSYMALELAQLLRAAGREVRVLAVMDAVGPGGRPRLGRLARIRLHLGLLQKGGFGYLSGVLSGKSETLRHRFAKLRLTFERAVLRNAPAFETMEAFVAANAVSIAGYKPEPYAGRMTIFRAAENVFDSPQAIETGLGWKQVAAGGFDLVEVQGNHLSILEEPGVNDVAAALIAAMQQPK